MNLQIRDDMQKKPRTRRGFKVVITCIIALVAGMIIANANGSPTLPAQHIKLKPVTPSATIPSGDTSATASSTDTTQSVTQSTDASGETPQSQQSKPEPVCVNGSYVNSEGLTVCSPEQASTTPAGATAVCADGTYSFSQHRSGTCSHHGGVAQWL